MEVAERGFQMRLSCRYEQPENKVAELSVETVVDGEWRGFNLDFQQPGFLIFVYAILNCQHLYMRTNATERGLVLDSAQGSIDVLAGGEWLLEKLHVDFQVRLVSGDPSREDVDYIIDRMQHCPVSTNIRAVADLRTGLEFLSASGDRVGH
jgi:hypothetical protein